MSDKNLTDSYIKHLDIPEKRTEIYDHLVPSLAIRITPTGHKSFVYRYRFNKKVKRFTIGSYPAVKLAKARDDARDLTYQVGSGIDPLAERQKVKEPDIICTFAELSDRYKRRHLITLKKSTRKEYKRIIENELVPILGRYPAKDIVRKQIVDLLDEIAIDRKKPVQSNRIRAVLSSIFSFGIDKAIVEANPVQNIKRKKKKANGEKVEKKRKRIYTHDEIRAIWDSFEQQDEPIQSIYKMLLLCAQRSGETRRMKWQDVDFKKQLWTIPAEQTKANRTTEVPVPEAALKILEKMQPLTGESEFVFQSNRKPGQPLGWLHKATKRIREESDVSDFRVHDLRRTAASYMAELGVQRTILGKVLNHKGLAGDDQVTAIYDRHTYLDEKRKALQRWSFYLEKILEEKEDSKIHKMG